MKQHIKMLYFNNSQQQQQQQHPQHLCPRNLPLAEAA